MWLVFLPRRARFVAAYSFLLLQLLILLTGNYGFFNLTTALLCLLLFDDQALGRVLPARFAQWLVRVSQPRRIPVLDTAAIVVAGTAIATFSLLGLIAKFTPLAVGSALQTAYDYVRPLHIVNSYGVFAVMTTTRPEVIVEGSDDGEHWRAYEFRYKPGDLRRRPGWNIPHQPRLDWQMWFAALDPYGNAPWFERFEACLQRNDPAVLALLANNPFPDRPPRYLRTLVYRYRYADAQTHRRSGKWWTREPLGPFLPPLTRAPEPAARPRAAAASSAR